MKKYSWKYTGSIGNAQKIGEELEIIETAGEVTARNVLDYAKKNEDSELYSCFEWDDKIAGEKFRLLRASEIISSISFVVEEEPIKKQKIYYSIKSSDDGIKKFKNIRDILEDDEDYKALIEKEDLKEIIFDIYREI